MIKISSTKRKIYIYIRKKISKNKTTKNYIFATAIIPAIVKKMEKFQLRHLYSKNPFPFSICIMYGLRSKQLPVNGGMLL
jgi:hypothetical protein